MRYTVLWQVANGERFASRQQADAAYEQPLNMRLKIKQKEIWKACM